MSVAEMKLEVINKITLTDSEVVLQEVLALLNDAINAHNNVPPEEYDLLPHVDNIVSEREAVMKKLAQ